LLVCWISFVLAVRPPPLERFAVGAIACGRNSGCRTWTGTNIRKAEYATDKPAWDCYGALVLWAAYDELPTPSRRETAKRIG